MRPENTDSPARRARKREAVWGAVGYVLVQLLAAAVLLAGRLFVEAGWLDVLLLVLAAADLLSIPPVFLVLRQRIKEIEGGELDAAGKY